MRAVSGAGVDAGTDPLPARARWWPSTARQVSICALTLVAVQLVVRAIVAFSGDFYWDDLILVGRSGQLPALSPEFLFYDHDGHLMPAAFLTAWVSTAVAPLNWAVPAVTVLVLQALASLAVLRVLRLLLGSRPVLLAPLAFYLFSPLTVPSFTWWAAALNSLPLQIGLAWVAGDAIRSVRTRRIRFAVSGTAVTALATAFFEKSMLVPVVAFVVVVLMYRVDGVAQPVRRAWRRGRPLWIGLGVFVVAWAAVYLRVTQSQVVLPTAAQTAGLAHHGTSLGFVPALLGGPWAWERWAPAPPWATPPTVLVVLGWIAVLAALAWSIRYRERTAWVWVAMVGYVAICEAVMILARSGPGTAYELAQTLRYFADSAVVVAIGWALVMRAPRREGVRALPSPPSAVVAGAVALFVASSLWSTVAYVERWRDDPARDYLAEARASLAADRDSPLLDQPVALHVLLPVAFPHNMAGQVFGPLRDRPDFAQWTDRLRMLDDSGRLVPAAVFATRTMTPGPVPGCGRLVEAAPVDLPLDGPLVDWEWTAEIDYLASMDGSVEVALDGSGTTVTVPVQAGPNQVFVRLFGAGEALRVRAVTPGLSVCVDAGRVGFVAPVS